MYLNIGLKVDRRYVLLSSPKIWHTCDAERKIIDIQLIYEDWGKDIRCRTLTRKGK